MSRIKDPRLNPAVSIRATYEEELFHFFLTIESPEDFAPYLRTSPILLAWNCCICLYRPSVGLFQSARTKTVSFLRRWTQITCWLTLRESGGYLGGVEHSGCLQPLGEGEEWAIKRRTSRMGSWALRKNTASYRRHGPAKHRGLTGFHEETDRGCFVGCLIVLWN